MKILVVCQYFYPEQFRVNDICFELVKDGHNVTVLTGLPNYPSGVVDNRYKAFKNRTEIINGVKVIRSWLLGRGKGSLQLALNYVSFAISSTLKAMFIKRDFDIILVYQLSPVTMALPGILLKKLAKKPLILYCHDLWPESITSAGVSTEGFLYLVLLKLCKWIYRSADEIFISSQLFKEYFCNKLLIQSPITHLPVYAEALFEGIGSRVRQDDSINLLFAGNIGEMQSVETIILAANELKDAKHLFFHLVGDGSSRERCEELAGQLGLLNVIFHGQHPITEMPKFYEMADAFLITLKANKIISYTLPNKIQSYMAARKPIIGAIDGETQRVIIEANCGLCVTAENYLKLAEVIRQFVVEKDKHSFYGRNARDYYDRNFSKEKYMKRLKELLKSAGGVNSVQR
ncbi:glycosyltransferase family 4 protein [Neobacillus drentensis]|uniref:glycosyltransferase family 4 protein n=1 Tax=Neobacillus drentensis TaxID=220684 RepID=UPI002FFE33DD